MDLISAFDVEPSAGTTGVWYKEEGVKLREAWDNGHFFGRRYDKKLQWDLPYPVEMGGTEGLYIRLISIDQTQSLDRRKYTILFHHKNGTVAKLPESVLQSLGYVLRRKGKSGTLYFERNDFPLFYNGYPLNLISGNVESFFSGHNELLDSYDFVLLDTAHPDWRPASLSFLPPHPPSDYNQQAQAALVKLFREAASLSERETALEERVRLDFLVNHKGHSRIDAPLPEPDFIPLLRPSAGWPVLFVETTEDNNSYGDIAGLWEATVTVQLLLLLRPLATDRDKGRHPAYNKAQYYSSLLVNMIRNSFFLHRVGELLRDWRDPTTYLPQFNHAMLEGSIVKQPVFFVPQQGQRQIAVDIEFDLDLRMDFRP